MASTFRMLAYNHITPAVAAMDSCSALIGARRVNIMNGRTRVSKSLYCRGECKVLRLYGENLLWVEESLAHPSYPGRATFFLRLLKKLANRLPEKQKVGSVRRANLSPYEHFGSTSRFNSRQSDRHSEHARALFSFLGWGRGVNFWRPSFFGSYKRVLFLTSHKIRPNITLLFCSNFLTSYHQLIVCVVCLSQAELIRRYDTTLKKPRGD